MGVDTGKELHVVISRFKKDGGRLREVIYIGTRDSYAERADLMKRYNVRTCVIAALPDLDICDWSAADDRVRETVGQHFDALNRDGRGEPILRSAAVYDDGRWQLVLQRAREPSRPAGGAVIDPTALNPVGFVIWDAGNHNVRAVSSWHELTARRTDLAHH